MVGRSETLEPSATFYVPILCPFSFYHHFPLELVGV